MSGFLDNIPDIKLGENTKAKTPVNKSNGLKCPKCGKKGQWKTTKSLQMPGFVKRRKKCENCGYVMNTREIPM